ncbi:MAG: hypothetical protein JNJ80_13120 [Gemmatimonadetes bacterium]|nr:hypothetical protein [Gemmatimonadota bacterium]
MHRLALIALVTAAGSATAAAAQTSVEAQFFLGSALSAPSPVSISQDGQPDIDFTARWATKPGRATRYYAWRIGVWRGNRGWRFDHTHHKIYLKNNPPEVQEFRITNGFNIFTVSRAFRHNHLTYSLGAGPVVAFPINTVRGKKLDHDRGWDGYLLSGGTVIAMATREFPIVGGLVASLDARGSASYVRVPVVDGHASVPNAALHFHAGVGYRFGKR